jgi:hypothetical protein
MATIVFGGGHELRVHEDAPTVIQRVSAASDGSENLNLSFTDGAQLVVKGWFSVTADAGATLAVRPDTVAYVLP